MRYVGTFALLLGLGSALPAAAQMQGTQPGGNRRAYHAFELQQMYTYRLKALRAEALRRQAADGGKLSAASLTELQVKLDRINATRVRDARNNDLMSVDSFGANVRPKG